jgi:hypothetical protein
VRYKAEPCNESEREQKKASREWLESGFLAETQILIYSPPTPYSLLPNLVLEYSEKLATIVYNLLKK